MLVVPAAPLVLPTGGEGFVFRGLDFGFAGGLVAGGALVFFTITAFVNFSGMTDEALEVPFAV
jgi:hypothetical protein